MDRQRRIDRIVRRVAGRLAVQQHVGRLSVLRMLEHDWGDPHIPVIFWRMVCREWI